mmetsp:Transcript_4574/g.13989  ORF Transcript_4574/g.13989 Transcript_4574/m.13989 type:complete len:304 (+) Transcript_4574:1961-2872(+)
MRLAQEGGQQRQCGGQRRRQSQLQRRGGQLGEAAHGGQARHLVLQLGQQQLEHHLELALELVAVLGQQRAHGGDAALLHLLVHVARLELEECRGVQLGQRVRVRRHAALLALRSGTQHMREHGEQAQRVGGHLLGVRIGHDEADRLAERRKVLEEMRRWMGLEQEPCEADHQQLERRVGLAQSLHHDGHHHLQILGGERVLAHRAQLLEHGERTEAGLERGAPLHAAGGTLQLCVQALHRGTGQTDQRIGVGQCVHVAGVTLQIALCGAQQHAEGGEHVHAHVVLTLGEALDQRCGQHLVPML